MIARTNKNILFFVLFIAIVSLALYITAAQLGSSKYTTNNVETINEQSYVFGETSSVELGSIKNADNAFIHLKLRFRANSTEGYPNVFQTAPANQGLRMEISGSTAALIVADYSLPDDLKGLILTSSLKTGQWYSLEINALNGAYINAFLDGNLVADYVSAGIFMETTRFLVGEGFDSTRIFRGSIDDISVTKGNRSSSWSLLIGQWLLILLCGAAFLISVTQKNYYTNLKDPFESATNELYYLTILFGSIIAIISIALLLIRLYGLQHIGHSKWLVHLLLPIILITIVILNKLDILLWRPVKWLISLVLVIYAISMVGSIHNKIHAYDTFILAMLVFCPLAFAKIESLSKYKESKTRLFAFALYVILLALSWSSLVDLTNWNAFRQMLEANFSISIIGAFLVLRAVFFILSKPSTAIEVLHYKFGSFREFKRLLPLIFLDISIIYVFFWISFREDSLFIPGSEYHWAYFVGVVEGVRNGGWLLWDTPSQYGFLNILLASLVPSTSAWQSFYIFQGILLFLVSVGIYLAAIRCIASSIFVRLATFSIIFMSLFFADPELIGPYPFPSSSVVRFFCVYLLVLMACFIPKFGIKQAITLSIVWSLALIWSAESAIYGTAIFLFVIVALLLTYSTVNNRLELAVKYGLIATLCLVTVLVMLFTFYFVRLGVVPDLSSFYEHAIGYAEGFGYVPFSLSGPGNLLLLVFMGISILCMGAIRLGGDANDDTVAPFAAMAGCIWGISTYYIGRPVPQNITAMLPLIVMTVYFSVMLSKRMSPQRVYSLPIKIVAIPLLFLVLIPVFNLKWVNNLAQIKSFTSNVTANLPKATDELQQLIDNIQPLTDESIVYYGDDAAPPILSGDYARLNERNWLPIPLQLLEQPLSEARRKLYLTRYICRNQPNGGILVNRNSDSILVRLQGFLHELNQFYDVQEVILGDEFTMHRYSGINLQHCPAEVGKKTS